MKTKTYKIDESTILPKNLAQFFNTNEYCVVDIETTGLSRQYNKVILIGVLYNVNNSIVLKQFFAENTKEEIDILNHFSHIVKNFSYIVTYNGAAFDIPFLKERFAYNNLEWDLNNVNHIDILQYLRKNKNKLPLNNLKLKTVEKFMGIIRKDTISGKDSVLLYKEYIKNPNPSIEKTILLHNYEDIYYLNALLNIFNYIHIDKNELLGKHTIINYKSKKVDFRFYPKDICIKKNVLIINGFTEEFKDVFEVVHYEPNISFKWITEEGRFFFQLHLFEGTLSSGEKCNYIDLSDFNLQKLQFSDEILFNEKYFPSNLIIIKYGNEYNIDLIRKLFDLILNNILKNL